MAAQEGKVPRPNIEEMLTQLANIYSLLSISRSDVVALCRYALDREQAAKEYYIACQILASGEDE
jgi:hypothetical protein